MVTIFTRSTCAPCQTVKYFLNKNGVPYTEKNIDEPDNQAEFSKLTSLPMVPLVLVGDQSMQGANLPKLKELLYYQGLL